MHRGHPLPVNTPSASGSGFWMASAGASPFQRAIPTHLLFVFTPCFYYLPHKGKCKYTHGAGLQARSSYVASLYKLKVRVEAEML